MYRIRPATAADCRAIAEVQVDNYRTAYAGLFPQPYLDHFSYEEQEMDWLELITSSTRDILLVAETTEEQLIIGYVLATAKPDVFPGYDAEVVALHVRKSYQGKGAGKGLFKEAVKKLAERGCKSVMLWTLRGNPIRNWYESLQGKRIGEKNQLVGDMVVEDIAYGWATILDLTKSL